MLPCIVKLCCYTFPLLIVQEEACGKCQCCLLVEVVLGLRVVGVAQQRYGSKDILLYVLIYLCHGTAAVLGIKLGFGLSDIRNTKVLGACSRIICQTELVDKHEVIVRTADKSLAQALLKLGSVRSAKLLYGHNGMVGRRDGTVCPPPDVQHTVIIALGDILPMVCLTDEAVIVLYSIDFMD